MAATFAASGSRVPRSPRCRRRARRLVALAASCMRSPGGRRRRHSEGRRGSWTVAENRKVESLIDRNGIIENADLNLVVLHLLRRFKNLCGIRDEAAARRAHCPLENCQRNDTGSKRLANWDGSLPWVGFDKICRAFYQPHEGLGELAAPRPLWLIYTKYGARLIPEDLRP